MSLVHVEATATIRATDTGAPYDAETDQSLEEMDANVTALVTQILRSYFVTEGVEAIVTVNVKHSLIETEEVAA